MMKQYHRVFLPLSDSFSAPLKRQESGEDCIGKICHAAGCIKINEWYRIHRTPGGIRRSGRDGESEK